MGHQFSTPEHEVARSSGKGRSSRPRHLVCQDDLLSRATEITDESSTTPPSASVMNSAPPGGLRHSQSWRRGTDSADSVTHVGPRKSLGEGQFQLPQGHDQSRDPSTSKTMKSPSSLLHRRDSDPGSKGQRRTVPVKCPQRKTQSVTGVPCHPGSEGQDTSYLERMYDSRTWAMYWRIMEARQKSQQEQQSASSNSWSANGWANQPGFNPHHHRHHCPYPTGPSGPQTEDTLEWENLQHDYGDSFLDDSGGQHEMIFLFDF